MSDAPGRGKTILAPHATGLVAYAVIGRGKTVEVTLPSLDGLDDFGFFGFARVQAVGTGDFPYSLNLHNLASLRNGYPERSAPPFDENNDARGAIQL
ncbi:MAG TPA: hypothetical protein VEI74_12605 [Candidatus Methylomirabilis sp.]|nr:hypothetical protein [Candidatus Methylomirabilis sp.]